MSNLTDLTLVASGDREIVMTQVLKAPPRLVFDALTRPELMHRWFGRRAGRFPSARST